MQKVTFQKGKRDRNELYLPSMRFVVATDWIDKLGPNAFIAWLKFHTWVDRTDANREYDKIPYTLEDVAKKLGMSKATLYKTVIRPLWEYYLIDLVEYEGGNRKGQKPVNIIVYESPMNKHETEIQPLQKLRDWEKDYGSTAQIFGRKGGRPKKETEEAEEVANTHSDRLENKTVVLVRGYRLKNKTVYRLKNKTVTVLKTKPNNVSNKLIILSNKPNNVSNNHHQKGDDDGSAANTPAWETDLKYATFRLIFTEAGADDIIRHDWHYPKYLEAVQEAGYTDLLKYAQEYIKEHGAQAQICLFIGGEWKKVRTNLQKNQNKKKKEEKLPKAIEMAENGQAPSQPVQPQDDEPLEDKQARIRAKLKLMNEKLENRKVDQPL